MSEPDRLSGITRLTTLDQERAELKARHRKALYEFDHGRAPAMQRAARDRDAPAQQRFDRAQRADREVRLATDAVGKAELRLQDALEVQRSTPKAPPESATRKHRDKAREAIAKEREKIEARFARELEALEAPFREAEAKRREAAAARHRREREDFAAAQQRERERVERAKELGEAAAARLAPEEEPTPPEADPAGAWIVANYQQDPDGREPTANIFAAYRKANPDGLRETIFRRKLSSIVGPTYVSKVNNAKVRCSRVRHRATDKSVA